MSIKISGTDVIDNDKHIVNVVGYYGPGIATQAEAETGTDNSQLMTPLRVAQAIAAAGGSVVKSIQRGQCQFNPNGVNASTAITAVNASKSICNYNGLYYGGAINLYAGTNNAYAKLSPAGTSVSSSRYSAGSGQPIIVYWEVVEFN